MQPTKNPHVMSSRRDLRSFIHTPPASSFRPWAPIVSPASNERSRSDISFGVFKEGTMEGGVVGAMLTQNKARIYKSADRNISSLQTRSWVRSDGLLGVRCRPYCVGRVPMEVLVTVKLDTLGAISEGA